MISIARLGRNIVAPNSRLTNQRRVFQQNPPIPAIQLNRTVSPKRTCGREQVTTALGESGPSAFRPRCSDSRHSRPEGDGLPLTAEQGKADAAAKPDTDTRSSAWQPGTIDTRLSLRLAFAVSEVLIPRGGRVIRQMAADHLHEEVDKQACAQRKLATERV
jgi:hypothetical protein